MAKNRYIDTKFWDDNFIVNLDAEEKLLFIYCLTNPLTTICGIYEITLRRILFDTSIKKDKLLLTFKKFENAGKIKFENDWIAIKNFIKHQKVSDNPEDKIRKGINNSLSEAPSRLISWINGENKPLEGVSKEKETPLNPLKPLEGVSSEENQEGSPFNYININTNTNSNSNINNKQNINKNINLNKNNKTNIKTNINENDIDLTQEEIKPMNIKDQQIKIPTITMMLKDWFRDKQININEIALPDLVHRAIEKNLDLSFCEFVLKYAKSKNPNNLPGYFIKCFLEFNDLITQWESEKSKQIKPEKPKSDLEKDCPECGFIMTHDKGDFQCKGCHSVFKFSSGKLEKISSDEIPKGSFDLEKFRENKLKQESKELGIRDQPEDIF